MTPQRIDWFRPSLLLALATLAIHLLVNGRYGFFRDELYFIVCGRHPDWGYVDQPPLIPLIASWSYAGFGSFLLGFRLVPALAMAATVALTAEFAQLVGGGRFAQTLGGLCVLGGAVFLAHGLLLSTDMFQALTWLGCSWCVVRLAQSGDERWWLAFGAIAGFSLLGKYLIAFYLVALAVGLMVTPLRRSLARPWVYAGAAIAFIVLLPNLLWQWHHDWPFFELGAAGAEGKNLALSPLAFFTQQILLIGPASLPVWLAGLWAGLVRPAQPVHRAFAIAYLLLFAVFVATHGKAYYLAPIYPILLAIGTVAIERKMQNNGLRATSLAVVACIAVLLAPMAVPVLPVETYIAYARTIGISPTALSSEHQRLGQLPQHFADMFGWPEMAGQITAVYEKLPPDDRRRAVFYGQNYGEAAAIDVFAPALPPAISGHNNYYVWGPRGHDGSVVIIIGGDRKKMEGQFRSVEEVGYINTPYAIPYETNKPIYVLRGARIPLPDMWPGVKHYE